jgi:hypothetical protein
MAYLMLVSRIRTVFSQFADVGKASSMVSIYEYIE